MLRTHTLLATAFSVAACATDPQPDVEPRSDVDATITDHVGQILSAHDADGDGALSEAEAQGNPWLAAHFQEADLDGDGRVTADEAASLAHEIHAAHCDDGECDPHESPEAHVQKAFAQMDADASPHRARLESRGRRRTPSCSRRSASISISPTSRRRRSPPSWSARAPRR